MFASKSVGEHLVRGLLGIGAFALAVSLARTHPVLSTLFIGLAFLALRGCPLCWTMGLVQMVVAKLRGTSVNGGACVDGRCAATGRQADR